MHSDLEKIPWDGESYSHDAIMEACLKWIREVGSDEEKPFFCYIPTAIPHAAMDVPEDDAGPWRKQWPEYEEKKGKYGGDTTTNPAAQFAGMMTRLDREVGRVMAMIEELGEDENLGIQALYSEERVGWALSRALRTLLSARLHIDLIFYPALCRCHPTYGRLKWRMGWD